MFPVRLEHLLQLAALGIRHVVHDELTVDLDVVLARELVAGFAQVPHQQPVLSDRRYIRIEEKPLLIVFQPALLRDAVDIVRHWKNRAKTLGFPGLYLVAVNTDVFVDPRSIEFDAGLEFPPLQAGLTDVTLQHSLVDADFGGRIYSYAEMADASSKPGGSACLTFPTVIPGWDEEGARPGEGDCAAGANPALYANWLKKACDGAMLGRPAFRNQHRTRLPSRNRQCLAWLP